MGKQFQTKKARIALLIGAMFLLFIVREGVSQAMNLHMLGGLTYKNTPQKSSTAQAQVISQAAQANSQVIEVYPQPAIMPTRTPQPTATPKKAAQPTAAASGQGSTGPGLRYFTAGTAVSVMQAGARAMSKQQVKVLIEKEVDNCWGVVQSALGFSTKEKAYAFFLGMATRESTLNAALETGSGPSHSYGPLQAAETAYANANPNYAPENDVPEMVQYNFTPQNYYDPGIAVYMGIRHLIHFSRQAKAKGYSGIELLRHGLIGYNTGSVDGASQSWMTQYSDEIGALAGWYLLNRHLYDTSFTWTGDPQVNRSQPWGWY